MNYQEFKEAVIKAAKEKGIEKYELYYESQEGTEVETYQDRIESFSVKEGGGACFRCIYGGKAGDAATELFSEDTAGRLVAHAIENAAVTESDDPVILKETGDTYQDCTVREIERPDAAQLKETALALQKKLFEQDERVTQATQTFVLFQKNERAIMNSNGLDLSHSVSTGILFPEAVIEEGEEVYDGDELMVGDIMKADLSKLAEKAVGQAISKIGADSVDSRKYTCVFSGRMMASLLQTFSQVFYADTAQQGLSLLKGKEGEAVASQAVTLIDNPFYGGSSMQYPFDAEGSASYAKTVIENGIFKTFLYNLSTASKEGKETTGNAGRQGYASPLCVMPFHFYIKPGEITLEEMMSEVGDGLYITELNGLHSGANPITGDFSLAAAGYLIEGGKQKAAIQNFTVSDNFYEFIKKVLKVGKELEFGIPGGQSVYGTPCVEVADVSVAGK